MLVFVYGIVEGGWRVQYPHFPPRFLYQDEELYRYSSLCRVLGTQNIPAEVPEILRCLGLSAHFFQIVQNARRSRARVGALALNLSLSLSLD